MPTTARPDNTVREIEKWHALTQVAAFRFAECAVNAGKLLSAQKAKLKHGEWIPWVKANLSFGDEQARRYMRCFDHQARIDRTTNPTLKWDLTVEQLAALTDRSEPKKEIEMPLEIVGERPCNHVDAPKPADKASNERRLVFVTGQERPVLLGGRSLPTMREIRAGSEEHETLKFLKGSLSDACSAAQDLGISGDELLEMLRALLPKYRLNQNIERKVHGY